MNVMNTAAKPVVIKSILIIDDHPLYCDALVSTCLKLFDTKSVKSANTLADALRLVRDRMSPDLVFLDLKLPDVTGLSGFFKIKERLPDVPVLVISSESSHETIQMLMEVGAAGFIPKEASRSVIRDAGARVQNGLKFLPEGYEPQAKQTTLDKFTVQEVSHRIADLTPQQSRIMGLICAGKPNKQIAYELSLAEATVKAHITALLRRLGVSNRTQAAVLVNSANIEWEPGIADGDARALLN